jgi:Anti-sigma-K factor rskA
VTWSHERVEELLAGQAMGGLDPEDAALAERALLEHVPGCERCRRALEAYRLVSGDLALAASPVAPPETLLARIRHSAGTTRRRRRWWPAWAAGTAAAVVGLGAIGMSAWNLMLAGRLDEQLSEARREQGWLVDAISITTHPDSLVLPLTGSGDGQVSVAYVPGNDNVYVMATQLPSPRFTYHVWFTGGGKSWHAGVLEWQHGWAMLPVETDPDRWEYVILTDEPRGRPAPSASPLVSASVSPD